MNLRLGLPRQEYIASEDKAEAARCLRELAVPFFHHEVVKQALLLAMEAPSAEAPLLALLAHMAGTGLVSGSQMEKARALACPGRESALLHQPPA